MRAEKQLLLDDLKGHIESSPAMIFASYKGMNPNMAAAFRIKLANSGGFFEVVRKRILLKAAEASGVKLNLDQLSGHVGVIFAEKDPTETTKAFYAFSKDHEDVLQVLAGRFEGQICSAKDVEYISTLPSKDEMRSQLLATLEAVPSQLLATFEAALTSIPYCLENKIAASSEQ